MTSTTRENVLPLHRRVLGLVDSKLASASIWLIIGGFTTGAFGYLFQVVMGRMLDTGEYGLLSAIMAIFAVLVAPLGTLVMVISRKVSEYRANNDFDAINHFYYWINIRTASVAAAILIIYSTFAPELSVFLRIPSPGPMYLLGMLLFLNILPNINNAFLQGLQSFIWLSASSSISTLLKIAFSAILIWLGYGLEGALAGTILAAIAGWLITYSALHQSLKRSSSSLKKRTHLTIKPALPVLMANVAFAAMTQLDIVLVNYYFPAQQASFYAAASVLGKAVMYLPGGIAMGLFPIVAENHARRQSSEHLLLQAVGLTAILSGIGALVYYFFGQKIILLLYGPNYSGAGDVLKYYGFAMFPMALVLVAENFLIAKGKILFAYLFLFTTPLQLFLVYYNHESLHMVIAIVGSSGLLLAILGYGLLWGSFKKL